MQRGCVDDDDAGGAIEIQIVGNFDDGIRRQRDLSRAPLWPQDATTRSPDFQIGDP